MKTQPVDFEGNFGSQDPVLQPVAEDFTALNDYFKAHRAQNEAFIKEYRRAAKAQVVELPQEAGHAA